jgi:hypothetical protein
MSVAQWYGLPIVDVVKVIRDEIKNGLKLSDILTDGVHPNDAGYELYAQIIIRQLDQLILRHVDKTDDLPTPKTDNLYETASMLELSKLDLADGWDAEIPSVVGTWFDHTPSRWMDSVIRPRKPGAVLQIPIVDLKKMTGIGLYYERNPEGKPLIIEVNGKPFFELDCSNEFDFSRVNYNFKFLSSKILSVVLRAPQGGPAAAAYFLYTLGGSN